MRRTPQAKLRWIRAPHERRILSLAARSAELAMTSPLKPAIVAVLDAGQDLTLATVRPDGWPQATTVSYVSEGLDIYFGTDAHTQKAENIAHDDRVSVTIDLPYGSWDEIRGVSLSGHARRLTDPQEMVHAAELFLRKFPQIEGYLKAGNGELALFRIEPEFVSLLDYRQGFGHTDLVCRDELVQPAAAGGAAAV
jgi:nitroimidazol reductase NimA-like FMN-containing flavoprotein (pyridoxamine 5'-phosphate oxidase superfamily)